MTSTRLRALLGSAASVGAGYLVLGGAGYVFLAVASRVYDDAEYSALASVYLIVNIIGPGLFAAVEQETSRHMATRLARDEDVRPVMRRLGLISGSLFGGVALLTLALSPVLLPDVLNGDVLLLAGLLIASAAYAVVSVTRGNFGGRRAFGRYGTSVGTEGTVRLAAGVVVAALALGGMAVAGGASAYGLAFCLAPLVAVLVTARWFVGDVRASQGTPAPAEPIGPLARSVGLLTVAWGLSLAIANAAPVVVRALLPNDAAGDATAATFASAVVLARIPLFVFQGAQSLVLPSFARAAAKADEDGDPSALRRAVRPALLLVAAVGVLALLVSAVLGHWLGRIAFGPDFTSSNGLVTALMVGTVAGMAVQIVQPALLALGRHRWVAGGWVLGAVVFAAAFALPFTPVTDAVIAQLASGAVTVGVLGVVLFRALRTVPPSPSPGTQPPGTQPPTQEFTDAQPA
ncbi:lipopolysaccharide biosynthesis protein [Cryptosporangium minutisporangium]|uniref:Polysaccharide biosynthesis protein n=1 Tax=Cryptosporangium minutisporangium TaxID=113569 RepID=A0ABP6T9E7_9ACTN